MDGEGAAESERTRIDKQKERTGAPRRARRIVPLIVAVGAVLTIALGVGAVYAYETFLARPPAGMSRLLPASTMAYFTFDAAPGGKQGEAAARLRQAFESQPGFSEAWDRITRPLVDALNPAGQEHPAGKPSTPVRSTPAAGEPGDLSQYLGGKVTVALLPLSSDDVQKLHDSALGTGAGEPESQVFDVLRRNVVALVDLNFDVLSKRGLLSELKRWAEDPSQASVVDRYEGMDIRRFDTGSSVVYFALVDGSSTAVVGANPEPVRSVIDTLREGRSLSSNLTHSDLVGDVPADRVAALYVNLTEVYRCLRLADPKGMDSGQLRDLRGGVLLTLGAYDKGLQLDVATEADITILPAADVDFQGPRGLAINSDAHPDVRTLDDVPLDADAFLVGADLSTPLDQLLEIARRNIGSGLARQIAQFEADTGLDIATDVSPLLTGDYILSARLEKAADGSVAPSLVFEVKLPSEARARAALDKIAAARGDTGLKKIAGADFHVARDSLAYGTVSGRAWIAWAAGGTGATESLARAIDSMGKGIVKTSEWREEAMVLPRYSNVIARADGGALRKALEANGDIVRDRQAYERDVAPLLGPLKYVLVGSASYEPQRVYLSRNHTVVFFGIGE